MEKHTLSAQKRSTVGREVKALRRDGILPATIYGKGVASQNVQVQAKELLAIIEETGGAGLIELALEGKTIPVLLHNIQRHPVTHNLLHTDFFQVNLKEKIHTSVPVAVIGESPAVRDKVATLLNLMTEIEVEALPTDIPEHIEVDISSLTEVDQTMKISQLTPPKGVKFLTDGEQDVVKLASLVSKEAEQQAQEDAAAVTAAPAEGAEAPAEDAKESAAPAESSEKPKEEKK